MEMYLPPFQINEENLLLPQSQSLNWGFDYLDMHVLHSVGLTGKGIVVAVIDSGIEIDHSDLIENVLDADNVSGEAFSSSLGHGSAVAGIIAATDNQNGVRGYAPDSKIFAIKAMRESGGASYSKIVEAMYVAKKKGVHIINMSLGGPADSPELKKAVRDCISDGIIVCCAAGNSGRKNDVMYPARYDETFCVSSINERGKSSGFVSKGWEVDASAPGEKLLTTYKNNTYSLVSGTSFATPVVSGIFACLLQAGIRPTHEMLKRTSTDIEESGFDIDSGWGVISPRGILSEAGSQGVTTDKGEYGKLREAYYLLGEFLRDKDEIV